MKYPKLAVSFLPNSSPGATTCNSEYSGPNRLDESNNPVLFC